MSYHIKGTNIYLTRGDTFAATILLIDADGNPYIPNEGDSIRFAMKEKYEDIEPLLVKDIPISTMQLVINPEETKGFNFGQYVYDIQLTKVTGEVDTFITKAILKLTEEVC